MIEEGGGAIDLVALPLARQVVTDDIENNYHTLLVLTPKFL